MPQFAATIKHLQEGVKGFTVAAAVKNIEGWEATLAKVEVSGVKGILHDLESLKKHLQAEHVKGDQVQKLVAKLAKETVTIAGKPDVKDAEKIKQLGEALAHVSDEKADAKADHKADAKK